MADEMRRVRTQAERDADGQTWHPGGPVSGDPVEVHLHPDECVLVVREGVGVMCVRDHERHDPEVRAMQIRTALAESIATGKPVLLPDGSLEIQYRPRRWWHRLTRREL